MSCLRTILITTGGAGSIRTILLRTAATIGGGGGEDDRLDAAIASLSLDTATDQLVLELTTGEIYRANLVLQATP